MFNKLYEYSLNKTNTIAIETTNYAITYGQLYKLICRNRRHLMNKGVFKKTVVYKVKNQAAFICNMLSLLSAECWVVPVPPDVNPRFPSALQNAILIDSDFFIESNENDESDEGLLEANDQLCGIYHMTSGSTGYVKFCKRSLRALMLEGFAYQKLFSLNESRILSMAPIYHSFALGAAAFSSLVSGSQLKLVEKFIPRKMVSIITTWNANIVIGVPLMIDAIARVSIDTTVSFPSLKAILSGTGNVTKEVQDLVKRRFGIHVSVNYGSTETGGILSRLSEEPHDSIGKEMSGVEIKIIHKEGRESKINEDGEAYVKSPYMMSEYAYEKNPFIDGYFPMGDILKKDESGYYYIIGRIKNFIDIGGRKVNPLIIQEKILEYPGTKDCVVSKGIRKNGSIFIQAIVEGESINVDDIRRYLSLTLDPYQIPSSIKVVNKLKRNTVGKYIKNE